LLPSGKFPRYALAVAVALTTMMVLVILGVRAPATRLLYGDMVQTAIVLWASYCAIHVALRSAGYLRQLWMLFALALLIAAAAQGLETYYQNISHRPMVAPWPSDILFILWVAPLVMMFLPRPAGEVRGIDWPQVLDFVQVVVVGLTTYLYFFYIPSRWATEGAQMVPKILQVQTVRDAALGVGFAILAARAVEPTLRAFYSRLSFLCILASTFELAFFFPARPVSGQSGWNDLGYSAPYLFATVAAATWTREAELVPATITRRPRSTALTHLLPAGIPLLVLFMGRQIATEEVTIAWWAVATSVLVFATRLILTNEKQRRLAEYLLRTEKDLLRSENMFSTAFRLSPDPVGISLVPEGRFVEVNDSFSRFTGYSREETLGKTGEELNLWVDLDHRNKVLARLREQGEVREEEFECRTKSGDIRIGQFSGALIELHGRLHSLVVIRDVSARRQAEDALRASEERFRTLLEDLHVGIVVIGAATDAQFVNRAALQTFGLQEDQALGKNISNFGLTAVREDGTEIPLSMCPGPRAVETRRAIHNEVVGWRVSGSNEIVWTLMDAVPQLTGQGEVASVILSVTNMTERKRAEQALRASEERFRTVVQSLHVGIVLMGPEADILFANQAATQMFNMQVEEALGKNSSQLGLTALYEDGTEMPFAMRPSARALETGKPIRNEVMGWRRGATDEILWILGEVIPLFEGDGQLYMLVSSFSDITKRKQTEEALHELSARLLQLQDEERRRMGRELHDSLAQSVLAVNLNLAQIARATPPLDERAQRAMFEARRVLQEMSKEIRTLSYLLHPPVLDELGLASAIEEYAGGFSERSGIQLEVDLQPGFGRLSQEAETALFRIVQESLSNIQRHSGSETAKIRLRVDDRGVELMVSDSGRGMDRKTIERSRRTRTRLGVGILGMRERMAQLGGKLEVESDASGTKVRAAVPLKIEVTHAPSHPRGG
jgi:PAS domain S-box-containing protein